VSVRDNLRMSFIQNTRQIQGRRFCATQHSPQSKDISEYGTMVELAVRTGMPQEKRPALKKMRAEENLYEQPY